MLDILDHSGRFPFAEMGSLVLSVRTTNPVATAPEDEFTYVDLSAVDQTHKVISGPRQVLGVYAPSRARQVIRNGDVLVSTVRPNLNGVALVPADLDGAIASTGFCVLRPDPEKLDANFLFHWVRASDFVDAMVKQATGASYPAVSDRIIQRSMIPLPSVEEQRRIAAILDEADALRAKRRAALAQLDDMVYGAFVDMFGDPNSDFHGGPETTLDKFFLFRTGKLDSNAAVESGRYPFFTCAKEDFRIDTHAFDCEALLLAGNNANAEYSVKYYKGKFNAYQRTYVINLLDGSNSYQYAKYALEYRLDQLKRISKGTNTKYLTLGLLNAIRIPLPPPQLQCEFAQVACAIDNLKNSHRRHLSELDSLFASLQHRAFRGEL